MSVCHVAEYWDKEPFGKNPQCSQINLSVWLPHSYTVLSNPT